MANYGQGFLSFGIFGLDRHLIILPFKKRLLGLWQGRGEDLSPSGVPEEVRLTCTQFVRYHKDQCVQDIVHTHRYEYYYVCFVFSFACVRQYVWSKKQIALISNSLQISCLLC